MGHTCCVVNCKNNGNNSSCKFYSFPTTKWTVQRRQKWIAAVKRKNADGSPWYPKRHDKICSDHFIGGKKSDAEASPSYIPTIFPSIYRCKKIDHSQVTARYNRFMTRRCPTKMSNDQQFIGKYEQNQLPIEIVIKVEEAESTVMADKGCQADIYSQFKLKETTFICNRYVQNNNCDAEIQVEIPTYSKIVTTNTPKTRDIGCCTNKVTHSTQSTSTNSPGFFGISSIKNDQQLLDLAGVSFKSFDILLKRMSIGKCAVSKKDQLLIFLMKFKSGLTFSALSVFFGIHRTTISRIFYHILQNLAVATADLVFWPNKAIVQASMPDCFHPAYSDTRVIIDCTELRIEVPSAVDDRVACDSHCKKGFTAKVIIGITPGGIICFKSKVAGGSKTDSQITVESGLIDKLETGDLVLAVKSFPEIKNVIDTSGKEIKVVMPPFLQNKNEFTKEETQQKYDIARVRMHVERIMRRLRVYRILEKIPHNLFDYIDNIVHVCCVLVNLQLSIIDNSNGK